MRILTLAAAGLLAATPAAAQAAWTAQAGLAWSTLLVEDDIVDPITVRPGLAPTLLLGVALPAFPKNRLGLEVAVGRPGLDVEEEAGTRDLMTVTTLTATLGLDGRITDALRWRAGLGVISYIPGEDEWLFADGTMTTWLVGAGLTYHHALSGALDLVGSARYDYHRFTTDALERQGFANPETVHRVTVGLGVGGLF